MAAVLTLSPVSGQPGTYAYKMPDYGSSLDLPISSADLLKERQSITDLLSTPGQSPYTPELTADTLALIRRRAKESTASNVAAAQSDMLARGGTGSSTEYGAMGQARSQGAQDEADQTLQFLLGAADKAAADRQFRVNTALNLYGDDQSALQSVLGRQFQYGSNIEGYNFQADQAEIQRQFEQEQLQKYMDMLAQEQSAARKSRRKIGLGTAIGSIGGGVLGGFATGGSPTGIMAGSQAGSSLGFLFS